MPRKQVLVQLDNELVEELDAFAAEVDVSRSELLRQAARLLLDNTAMLRRQEQDRLGYLRIPDELTWQDEYAAMAAERPTGYTATKKPGSKGRRKTDGRKHAKR